MIRHLLLIVLIALGWGSLLSPALVQAFSASPSTMDIEAGRGEKIDRQFTVTNTSSKDQTYYFGTLKFVPVGDSGSPQFIPFEKDHAGLPEWIQFSAPSALIQANSKQDIPFSVVIPADSAAGTFYAAVTISTAPAEIISTGATVEAKTALLLFLTVKGTTTEKLALINFGSGNNQGIRTLPPKEFTATFQNQGNTLLIPEGTITIRNIFGKGVQTLIVNPEKGRLLPNANRLYQTPWRTENQADGFLRKAEQEWNEFHFGPYKAHLVLTYGSEGKNTVSGEYTFWIVPWHALLLGGGILLIGISVLFLLVSFLRQKAFPARPHSSS